MIFFSLWLEKWLEPHSLWVAKVVNFHCVPGSFVSSICLQLTHVHLFWGIVGSTDAQDSVHFGHVWQPEYLSNRSHHITGTTYNSPRLGDRSPLISVLQGDAYRYNTSISMAIIHPQWWPQENQLSNYIHWIRVRTYNYCLPKIGINLERRVGCEQVTVKSPFKRNFMIRVHQVNQMLDHPVCIVTIVKTCPTRCLPYSWPSRALFSCPSERNMVEDIFDGWVAK